MKLLNNNVRFMLNFSKIIENVIEDTNIKDKEELFDKISKASSYFHVLELFKNSAHLPFSKEERVEILKFANDRLRELKANKQETSTKEDPYQTKFFSKSQ